MSIAEVFEKAFIPLLAAFIGAALAFRYQRTIELKREKRHLLQVLMMNRVTWADDLDWIKSLNVIDVVFHDNKRVREITHTFFAQLADGIIQNRQYIETYALLMYEMGKSCGYKNLELSDIRDSYSPASLKEHYPQRNVTPEP